MPDELSTDEIAKLVDAAAEILTDSGAKCPAGNWFALPSTPVCGTNREPRRRPWRFITPCSASAVRNPIRDSKSALSSGGILK